MRQVLSNHREVAHLWANRMQASGESGNMFFNDTTIYSYGHHFAIAKFIKDDLVLFTTCSYSVSTSKHCSYTRQAIPHDIEVLYVMEPDIRGMHTHIKNIEQYIDEIKFNLKKSVKARTYKESYLRSVIGFKNDLKRYLEIFRVKSKLSSKLRKQVNNYLNMGNEEILQGLEKEIKLETKKAKAQRIKDKIAESERLEKMKIDLKEKLAKWRLFDGYLPYSLTFGLDYLRYNKLEDLIETSQSIKISVDTFILYYKLIKKGVSLIGRKIDHYTVLGQTEELLTIGCHKIQISEIETIAQELGI